MSTEEPCAVCGQPARFSRGHDARCDVHRTVGAFWRTTAPDLQELRLVVVSDPVAKARPRVALRRGKAHAYTPGKTQEAEWRIRTAFSARFPQHQPWEGPVTLHVTAWRSMPASTPKALRPTAQPTQRPDADNYLKTVLDALNGVAFVDDSQVVLASIAKRYAEPGTAPGWEITLRRS